jgi:hypothetical protein
MSARIAYLEGSRGQAIPDRINEQVERVERYVDEIRTGERRLGRVAGGTAAAINQPIGVVDFDPLGSGVSIAGFRRGFR